MTMEAILPDDRAVGRGWVCTKPLSRAKNLKSLAHSPAYPTKKVENRLELRKSGYKPQESCFLAKNSKRFQSPSQSKPFGLCALCALGGLCVDNGLPKFGCAFVAL